MRPKQAPSREEILGEAEPEQSSPIVLLASLPLRNPERGEKTTRYKGEGSRFDSRWPEGVNHL